MKILKFGNWKQKTELKTENSDHMYFSTGIVGESEAADAPSSSIRDGLLRINSEWHLLTNFYPGLIHTYSLHCRFL